MSRSRKLVIGATFTPQNWAQFAIERFGIFDEWMSGKSIFDPTMGTGNLLVALVEYGRKKGYSTEELPLDRIYGNELNREFHQQALGRFEEIYGVDMSDNFCLGDIITRKPMKHDVLFGNPPWLNFTDLPEQYKEFAKSYFEKYGLVGSRQDLLLGRSRVDIAALIIQRSIIDFLSPKGSAYFFAPLSILLNDGAHAAFRNFSFRKTHYALQEVLDFNEENVFNGISTRYGLMSFQRGQKTDYPVPFFRREKDQWTEFSARPLKLPNDALLVMSPDEEKEISAMPELHLSKRSQPRQGINTSGANAIYFFNECEQVNEEVVQVNESTQLPAQFVFPLMTRANFESEDNAPQKWVLLPYDENGKPLSSLTEYPLLKSYLERHREQLENRKGRLIKSWADRGLWWSMLGVGAYNFAPYKIIWEAYGRSSFLPRLVEGNWQANQSLQAYIPAYDITEAKEILTSLQHPSIEKYLRAMKMEGTMNWAQPGKIKKLITFNE